MARPAALARTLLSIPAVLAALASPLASAQGCVVPGGRPFQAAFDFQEKLSGIGCLGAPAPVYALEGGGGGSHLGRFSVVSTNCSFPTPSGTTVNFIGQQVAIVAADGSRIHARYQGVGTPAAAVPGGVQFALEGTYVVEGGTGRFARATGCGWLTGVQAVDGNLPPLGGAGRIVLEGLLAY